mmetsp:Transcript_17025/g.28715  ORF Transcript_17025/g.28715 Transcript_17025/m.28715 type:complete len:326 (+) Transcript_17025:1540-2517(+)
MSWRRKVVPSLVVSTAQGMGRQVRGMSARAREGTHFSASASSGVSCFSFSDLVLSMRALTSSSFSDFLKDVSLSFSLCSIFLPRVASGCSSMVTRCGFLMSSSSIRGPNTSSLAMRSLKAASASVYFIGSKASPSYSHELMERSMRERPRGKRPVLFSRRLNSMVFTAASMASLSNPSLASVFSVDITSASTAATSSAFTPLRPMLNVGCRSSSSNPPPTSASPRPLSSSALRSGDADVPSIKKFKKLNPNSVCRSKRSSDRSQFTARKVLGSSSDVSDEAYFSTTYLGAVNSFCLPISELGSTFSKSLRYASRMRRRSDGSSSP